MYTSSKKKQGWQIDIGKTAHHSDYQENTNQTNNELSPHMTKNSLHQKAKRNQR